MRHRGTRGTTHESRTGGAVLIMSKVESRRAKSKAESQKSKVESRKSRDKTKKAGSQPAQRTKGSGIITERERDYNREGTGL